jgi:hypothetical protein
MPGLFRHRFKLLLGALLVLIIAMPVVFEILADIAPQTGRLMIMTGATLFMLAAMLVVSGKRGTRLFAVCLLAPSLLVEAGVLFLWPTELIYLHFGLRILFVAFIIGAILYEIFSPGEITFDTVCSSLCVYLLLGVVWESVYALMETAVPGSIVSATRTEADTPRPGMSPEVAMIFRMRYFSFTTLTSVGYGDIVPGTNLARMCAITQALVGQMYLLVMVSRLVGLHISQTLPGPGPPPES